MLLSLFFTLSQRTYWHGHNHIILNLRIIAYIVSIQGRIVRASTFNLFRRIINENFIKRAFIGWDGFRFKSK